jgi:hypothetical protein
MTIHNHHDTIYHSGEAEGGTGSWLWAEGGASGLASEGQRPQGREIERALCDARGEN